MAISNKIVHRDVDGLRHVRVVDHTLDNSYPTGGWPLIPSSIGFASGVTLLEGSITVVGVFLLIPDLVNKKLKAFDQAFVEVTNGNAGLNGLVARVTYKATGSPG